METGIKDLAKVINLPSGCLITGYSLSPLVEASGLSFSSSLSHLKIQWKIPPSNENDKNRNGGEVENLDGSENDSELDLIVKCMPDPSVWVSLNSETTFEKELNMYLLLVPQYLTIIHKLNGNSFEPSPSPDQPLFPKFYGGRLNLENSFDYVDGNAVIVLDNLKLNSYENCRSSKLDSYHFTQVLDRLALFHSVGIIIQHDSTYKATFDDLLKTSKTFFFGAKEKNIDQINADRRTNTMNIVKKFHYDQDVNERLMDILVHIDTKTMPAIQTCYYTLIHNDLWINNVMFKYGSTNDEIIDLKFLDFQNTNFGSIAKEFIFLLYTSVAQPVWADWESHVQYYHNSLVRYLSKYFKSNDFVTEYSLEKFKSELKTYACHKLKHIFIIMNILYGHDAKVYDENIKNILDHFIQNQFI